MTGRLSAPRRPVVLVVDDVAANRELLESYLADLGCDVRHAGDGLEALASVDEAEPDVVFLDIAMPGLDGLTVCARLKAHPTRRLIPVVLVTASDDRETKLRGLEAGADDFLTRPVDARELRARVRVLLRDRALNLQLDGAETIILSLARVVETRDLYTVHHSERVGRFAREIGHAHGLRGDDLTLLYQGGILHDIGKAFIPSEILLKSGPLTDAEWELMRTHSAQGAVICEPLRSATSFLPIIRHHHERFDGRGYPDHLAGADIPLGARIAAVADAWDAMVNERPYRKALDPDEALRRLREGAGTQWDPAFVQLFTDLAESGLAGRVAAEALTFGR
ncbi:MAG TPA: HD domain-containing phosphohydrolase [Candidatus Limnocylindria bacterium]|nr:HD domain-containing phosphohydrolase [Candidatus Limnocylindria bacterium]